MLRYDLWFTEQRDVGSSDCTTPNVGVISEYELEGVPKEVAIS
jgi:hypothetical protein